MNVGKLHTALDIIKLDVQESKIIAKMNDVKNALRQSINEPNENNTNNFRTQYSELLSILEECRVNEVTPTDKKLYDDINASSKIGLGLSERIKTLFQDYNITPAKALNEFEALINEVNAFYNSLISMVNEFKKLDLEYAGLDENKPVIGVSIPSNIVKNNLENVEKAIHDIDFVLKTFREVVGEGRKGLEVNFISSTDFQIFLISSMMFAYCFATALDKISELYKRFLEIKKLRNDLEKNKVPDKITKQIDEHINKEIEENLAKISDKLVDEYYKKQDTGRKNELKNGMRKAIHYLADKIDNGAIFEAEVKIPEEPQAPDGGEKNVEYKKAMLKYNETKKLAAEINEKGSSILSIQNGNKPILFIPEKVKTEKEKK